MTDRAQNINNYLDTHTLMQGFDRAIARLDDKAWRAHKLDGTGLQINGVSHVDKLHIATVHFRDAMGANRTLIAGRDSKDATTYHVWLSKPDSERVEPHSVEVKRDDNGKYYAQNGHVRVYNDRFMYDHQARAIHSYGDALAHTGHEQTSREVTVFATGTGKSYIIAHTLKAVGGRGVVIAPAGLGNQIRDEIAEVIPPKERIVTGANYQGSPQEVTHKLKGFDGVLVIEATDLERFIGDEKQQGWLCSGDKKQVFIDEAHEFTAKSDPSKPAAGVRYLQALAQHNDVLAITATPNPELYEALGIKDAKPAISMTMYDAMHRLPDRPFRPLSLELTKVGESASLKDVPAEQREAIQKNNEPNVRREALVGYFGREEYVVPDYFREHGKEWKPRDDNTKRYSSAEEGHAVRQTFINAVPNRGMTADAQESSVIEAMRENQICYSQHKNIAFAVRGDLVKNLAQDFQKIHDGTFEGIDDVTQEVWKRRAQTAIAAYVQTYQRAFGLPEKLEECLTSKNLDILRISDKNLGDIETLKKYREAIRTINPDDFRGVLPHLFEQIIKEPKDINLQQEATQAAEHTARSAVLRATAEKLLHISSKEARRLDMEGKLEVRLRLAGQDPEAITVEKPHYYALAVLGDVPGQEQVFDMKNNKKLDLTGDDVAQLVRAGKVMHVVNNYRFTTGFSDPDVMMTQRVIENSGDYIVRATQILGRPIREKDGVAAIQEIVGPFVNLEGKLGADRHFSCYDVVAKDYLDRVNEFSRNWQKEGQALWQPSTHVAQPSVTPVSPEHAQGRGAA
jgi:hypothetical protein